MATTRLNPKYDTVLFGDLFPDYETWTDMLDEYPELTSFLTESNSKLLYYLLVARYVNNPFCNWSIEQTKIKICSIIFQYGPTWQKRLLIQDTIRSFKEEDLVSGARTIFNHAYNPNSEPTSATLEELEYINEQNTNNYKRSKIEAYELLWDALRVDVSENFINRFKVCFKQFIIPDCNYIYEEED